MTWPEDLRRDTYLGLRTLLRDKPFTAAVVLTLALGIALAVAMFTVSDAVLRRPLPVRDQDRLVVLWGEGEGSPRRLPLAPEHFDRFRQTPRTLSEVAGTLNARAWEQSVRDGERTLMLGLAPVTGNFFDVLGSPPVLGRTLRPDDAVDGAAPVTVISHRLWSSHFEEDPAVIGRRLILHERGASYTVVGVTASGLEYPAGADLWVPLLPSGTIEVVPIARLVDDATVRDAAEELRASFRREASDAWRGLRADARTLPELVLGDVRPALLLLSAGAGLLLLIACTNVANLLLVRTSGRMQEIAVRRALGAARGRIARQLLTETALLGLAGGLLGLALSSALVKGALVLAPPELPRLEAVRLAGLPLGAAVALVTAVTLAVGLLTALWASAGPSVLLRAGERAGTDPAARRRTQRVLAILQVGLAVVVVSGAALLVRTLRELEHLDMGFTADRLALVQLAWPASRLDTPDRLYALYDGLIPRVESVPGVVSAAPFSVTPFAGAAGGIDGPFVAEGTPAGELSESPTLSIEVVSPGYFGTFGIPVRGRGFVATDVGDGLRVAVIDDSVARLFWPGQDAVGKRLAMGRPRKAEDWWTVVGVVPPTRYRALREPTPTVYLSYRQFMGGMLAAPRRLAVRTSGAPEAVVPAVRQAAREIDADVVVSRAETMERIVAAQLAQPRFNALLLTVFGTGALALAAVGVYAVLAYVVRRRTRELAIRHALGATPSRLRSLVLREAVLMAGGGAALGLAGALAGGRLVRSLLFGVTPGDPATLASVAALLIVVALAAAYAPARLAARVDPASLLKE